MFKTSETDTGWSSNEGQPPSNYSASCGNKGEEAAKAVHTVRCAWKRRVGHDVALERFRERDTGVFATAAIGPPLIIGFRLQRDAEPRDTPRIARLPWTLLVPCQSASEGHERPPDSGPPRSLEDSPKRFSSNPLIQYLHKITPCERRPSKRW